MAEVERPCGTGARMDRRCSRCDRDGAARFVRRARRGASGANRESTSVRARDHSKNAGSRISDTLTASDMPARASRGESVSRNSRSLITANGGAKSSEDSSFSEGVDPVLHADAGVCLPERRRRDAHHAHAAVGDRRCVARHVEHSAAADDQRIRLAIDRPLAELFLRARAAPRGRSSQLRLR